MKLAVDEKENITDVVPTESTTLVETDETVHTRLGWLVVLVGVFGFILWAFIAPLDKGVPLSGAVSVDSNRKAVQHQTGGIVDKILVKEGDRVEAGQVIVHLNDTQAKAQADITRNQLLSAYAIRARLVAERDGSEAIAYPPELLSAKDNFQITNNISTQDQLFISRNLAIKHELSALNESIAGLKMQLNGLQASRSSRQQQLGFLTEQLTNLRELAADGYVPRNRVLDEERTYVQLTGEISADTGNIGRTQRQISELTQQRIQRQQEHQKDIRQQLSDIQREIESLKSKLLAEDFELNNVLVKAPVDGTVVGIQIFTNGGVVSPGFTMMDIVPSEDMLIVTGQVPVHLIDKVHAGLPVDLIFSAFNQNKTPNIPGTVTQVSADRLVEERTGEPFYNLKAKVTPEGMQLLSEHQIRAGMPVEIFVKTGERSLMNYLFKPILDRLHAAMSEE